MKFSPEIIAKKLARKRPRRFGLPSCFEGELLAESSTANIYRDRWKFTLSEYQNWWFGSKEILHSVTWMGVPARKSPLDLWIYQEILHEKKPDVIIEIGSLLGGTSLFLAHICDLMGHGQIISIDLNHQYCQVSHPRITLVTGNSSESEVTSSVKALCEGRVTMVIHDGDHHSEQVLKDLKVYGELVTVGQYLIVEDGVVDIFGNLEHSIGTKWGQTYSKGGPLEAVRQYLLETPSQFTVDETKERFLITASPRGYLLRQH